MGLQEAAMRESAFEARLDTIQKVNSPTTPSADYFNQY
jgi:hypothetical protein